MSARSYESVAVKHKRACEKVKRQQDDLRSNIQIHQFFTTSVPYPIRVIQPQGPMVPVMPPVLPTVKFNADC